MNQREFASNVWVMEQWWHRDKFGLEENYNEIKSHRRIFYINEKLIGSSRNYKVLENSRKWKFTWFKKKGFKFLILFGK